MACPKASSAVLALPSRRRIPASSTRWSSRRAASIRCCAPRTAANPSPRWPKPATNRSATAPSITRTCGWIPAIRTASSVCGRWCRSPKTAAKPGKSRCPSTRPIPTTTTCGSTRATPVTCFWATMAAFMKATTAATRGISSKACPSPSSTTCVTTWPSRSTFTAASRTTARGWARARSGPRAASVPTTGTRSTSATVSTSCPTPKHQAVAGRCRKTAAWFIGTSPPANGGSCGRVCRMAKNQSCDSTGIPPSRSILSTAASTSAANSCTKVRTRAKAGKRSART